LSALLALRDFQKFNRLEYYEPYAFQVAFHHCPAGLVVSPFIVSGKIAAIRTILAGNKIGKTEAAGYELAMHLTGIYPDWWKGKRFKTPVKVIAAGPTNDKTRDVVQAILFGEPTDEDEFGTGTIPRHLILQTTRKAGVPHAFDSVLIKHASGGKSKIGFSAFEQKLESFMGFKAHIILLDEEPPQPVLSQCVRATIAHPETMILMTFTPEHGSTDLVYRLLTELPKGQGLVRAGWRDAPHIWDVPGRVEELRGMFPKYEWKMRENGDPVIGTGRVYDVPEEDITCEPFQIPSHWPRICGIDYGMDHPFAGCWGAHDPDTDTIYIYDAEKKSDMLIPTSASMLKNHGQWIPIAWPHDMAKRATGSPETKSGETIKELFVKEGCKMLENCFSNPPEPNKKEGSGGNSVSAGIVAITNRMVTGNLKVFSTCFQFFEEYRNYHTENGIIVKKRDDIMDAARYMCQSVRHAQLMMIKGPRKTSCQGARLWR